MEAVLELKVKEGNFEFKQLVKNKVLKNVWRIYKFPDPDSHVGKQVQEKFQKELGMEDQAFKNHWKSIQRHINSALRSHRAYVLQQFKGIYWSEFVMLVHC
jgi:hypothetical protein